MARLLHAPLVLVSLVVLAGVMFWAYLPSLSWIVWGWRENQYYSHGPLVPLLVGWLIWRSRAALLTAAWRTWWPGLGIVLLAGAAYTFGRASDINFGPAVSLVILIHGLVLTIGGPQVWRLLAFPLLFLFFAVPVSELLIHEHSFPLQMMSARFAAMLMRVFTGAESVARGSTMLLDGEEYVVGAECSGFKALLGLILVGLLVAYLTDTTVGRKIALAALAVPIAVASNVVRLLLILCAGRIVNHDFAVTTFHDLSGGLMLVVAVVLFLSAARLVAGPEAEVAGAPPPEGDGQMRLNLRWQPMASVALMLLVFAGAGQALAPPPAELPDVDLTQIPLNIGDWRGEEVTVEDNVFEELGDVAVLQRNYLGNETLPSHALLVVCGKGRRSLHTPQMCYRGSGLEIDLADDYNVDLGDETLHLKELVLSRDGVPVQLALYTFTDGLTTTPNFTDMAAGSTADRNVVWSQIQFVTGWRGTLEETRRVLKPFVMQAWPHIEQTLPDPTLRAQQPAPAAE